MGSPTKLVICHCIPQRKDQSVWCSGLGHQKWAVTEGWFQESSPIELFVLMNYQRLQKDTYTEQVPTKMCTLGIHMAHFCTSFKSFLKCHLNEDFSDPHIFLALPSRSTYSVFLAPFYCPPPPPCSVSSMNHWFYPFGSLVYIQTWNTKT